ncbi:sensor histidine kinase [Actinocorallia populi]|uniref:sensor histidine kinase n=1 Tax=Actinocorallia populi TaxID=2079200 RepID=UPI000D097D17|nr:histidine kinase [Actinocorallia populi]
MGRVRTAERLVLLNLAFLAVLGGLGNLMFSGRGLGETGWPFLVWGAAVFLSPVLQVFISLPRFERLRRRRRWWLYGLDLLLCFGPVLTPMHFQANTGYPMASTLLLFRGRLRWAVVFALFAATVCIDFFFWPENAFGRARGEHVAYWLLNNVGVGVQVYVVSRLARVMHRLHATRQEVSEAVVQDERGRVRRDVHDLLGFSLTVIIIRLEVALRALRRGKAEAELQTAYELVEQALASVRTVADGTPITSLAAEAAAAKEALEWAGVEARINVMDVPDGKADEALAYVLREGVTNVLRHSKASVCRVDASATGVRIVNDGAAPSKRPPGSGLKGLQARLAPLEGGVTAHLRDGEFTLDATLPGQKRRWREGLWGRLGPLLTMSLCLSGLTYLYPVTWWQLGTPQLLATLAFDASVYGLLLWLGTARRPPLAAGLTALTVLSTLPHLLGWTLWSQTFVAGGAIPFFLPNPAGLALSVLCAGAGVASGPAPDAVIPLLGAFLTTLYGQMLIFAALLLPRLAEQLRKARTDLTAVNIAKERTRFGLHLRDRLGSSLFQVLRALEQARQGENAEEELAKAITHSRSTSQEIRAIARREDEAEKDSEPEGVHG